MKYILYFILFLFLGHSIQAQQKMEFVISASPIRLQGPQLRVPYQFHKQQELHIFGLIPGHDYQLFVIIPKQDDYHFDITDPLDGKMQTVPNYTFRAQGTDCRFKLGLHFAAEEMKYGYITLTDLNEKEAAADLKSSSRVGPIATDFNLSTDDLIKEHFIKSSCVDVSNIVFKGSDNQRGIFSNALNSVGYQEGMMMASGGISVAAGPNGQTGAAVLPTTPVLGNDPDLQILLPGDQNHRCIIEFDFVPENDTIQFQYVFASEEYCDFANSGFNDVFGFFLSGPGLSGPFSNGGINIATIPNSTTFVSINNVNHINNAAYYHGNIQVGDNQLFNSNCVGHPVLPVGSASLAECQFDGLTIPMTAFAEVVPCETYHIKLAIADISDGAFDSGVFFKLNSFSAGDGSKAEVVYNGDDPEAALEGCSDVYFVLTKPSSSSGLPFTINFTNNPASTATVGLDYVNFPLSYLIPANKDTIHVNIKVLGDLIVEPNETIILNLINGCFCLPPQITVTIKDSPVLEVQLEGDTVCFGESITITPIVTGGVGNHSYVWSNNSHAESITVNITGSKIYSVTVTDQCNQVKADTAVFYASPQLSASIFLDTIICAVPIGMATIKVYFTGPGPWEFSVLKNGDPYNNYLANSSPFTFTVSEQGAYQIGTVINPITLCEGIILGVANVSVVELETAVTSTPYACAQSAGSIDLFVSGGYPGYQYAWSGGLANIEDPVDVSAGNYQVTITDAKGCTGITSVLVDSLPPLLLATDTIIGQNCNGGGLVTVLPIGGAPAFNYLWSTGPGGATLSNLPGGNYAVTVSDNNGCTISSSIVIPVDTIQPIAITTWDSIHSCLAPNITLNANGSSMGPNVEIEWSTPNGNIVSGGDSLAPVVNSPGIYILTIQDTSNGCQSTDTAFVSDTRSLPQIIIAAPVELNCQTIDQMLDGSSSSSGPNLVYSWSTVNGNIVSAGNTPFPIVDQSGSYLLTLTDTSNACSNTQAVEVFEDLTVPVVSINPADSLTCQLPNLAIDASGSSMGSDYQIQWTTVDGNILVGPNTLNPTINAAGTYVLTITNTTNACTRIDSITVFADANIPISSAGFTDTLDCNTNQIQLQGSASGGNNLDIGWTFSSGGNISAGASTLNPTVNAPGTYILTVTNLSNSCATTSSVVIALDTIHPSVIIDQPLVLNCKDLTVDLDGSASSQGPNMQYLWTTINGNLSGNVDLPLSMTGTPGLYTLTIFNTQNQCQQSAFVQVIQDIVKPTAIVQATDTLTCVQPSLTLFGDQSSAGAAFQYIWSTYNGHILSPSNTPNIDIDLTGDYQLIVQNSENFCADTFSIFVPVNDDVPVASTGLPDTINCIVKQIQLSGAGSSAGADFTYQWSTNGGNILSGGTTLSPLVNQAGIYQLKVTNQSNLCEKTSFVEIFEDVKKPIADAGLPLMINCQGKTVQLDGSGSSIGSIYDYHWKSLNSASLSDPNALNPDVSEGGKFRLIVLNEQNGCSDSSDVEVLENFLVADYQVQSPYCAGTYGRISVIDIQGGISPYKVSLDQGLFEDKTVFQNLDPGVYSLVLRDAAGCELDKVITVDSPEDFMVTLSGFDSIQLGESYQLQINSNVPVDEIDTIIWSPSEGLSCTNCLNPVVSPFNTTTYTMKLTTKQGCEASGSFRLNVKKSGIFVPDMFTPNGDGENDYFTVFANPVGIKKINQFMIFNRWGAQIFARGDFSPNDLSSGWDGKYKGKPLNPAVFIWWVEAETIDGRIIFEKGDVTLIR
ncbi:MAG: choice-of-anchor L domain-containing protein [Saprospiraceae bacterium]